MGMLSGFPFETKKDRERKSREYDERMFPLGAEKQWEKTLEVLDALVGDKVNKYDMISYTYLVAKDKYTTYKEDGLGAEAAKNELDRALKKNEEAKKLILTLIQLDTEAKSLDDFPTPERVREAAALGE